MRTASMRPGDLVMVDDGLPYIAQVREKQPRGKVTVEAVCHHAIRTISVRLITQHWRQTGTRRAK